MSYVEKLCKLAALHSLLSLHHFEPFLIKDVLSRDYEKNGLQDNNLVKFISETNLFRFENLVYSEEEKKAYIATNPGYFHFGEEFEDKGPNDIIPVSFQEAMMEFFAISLPEFRAIFNKPGEGLEALEGDPDRDYTFLTRGEYEDEQALLENRIAQFLLVAIDDRFQDLLCDSFSKDGDEEYEYCLVCKNCEYDS